MAKLRIGDVLRYSRPYSAEPAEIDGRPNYFHVTHLPGTPKALLEAGINPIGRVTRSDGPPRTPAILISSSPHREGSETAPWRDLFDPDNGHIRYFGDAKQSGVDASDPRGNRALLAAWELQSSFDPSVRVLAPPLLFFRRTKVDGVPKGYVTFQGFGVIERAELISQFNRKTGETFSNYVYDFAVLAMSREDETFDWAWVSTLRDGTLSPKAGLSAAPSAWREYVRHGPSALPRLRRRVAKLRVASPESQAPKSGSAEQRTLDLIYRYYDGKKHYFEKLAYEITKRILGGPGRRVIDGWVTPQSGDGGGDFVARLDLGEGFGSVRQVVYGQAKCVAPGSSTNGRDIARTVARLKRGWFGAFVTTGHISEPAQLEVIEDEYPILLVPGLVVAQQTIILAEEAGLSIENYLQMIEGSYLTANRRPEEILHF